MNNVLYISYDGMTDNLGQSQVLPYLCGLSSKGHKVFLISFEKSINFQKNYVAVRTIVDKNNIDWFPLEYTATPPIFSTLYDVWRMKKLARRIYRSHHINIVHCRSYIAALAGLMLKRQYGVKFVFDMRGFWADERVDGNIWDRNRYIYDMIYKYFKRKELQFFKNADFIISLTEAGKTEIESWKKLQGNKINIKVIPCCADFDLFSHNLQQQLLTDTLREELHFAKDDFILSYLGSIGTWYMLSEMLDFYKSILLIKPSARFLFITPDDAQNILQQAADKGIDTERIVIRKAARYEVPSYIALSNLSMFFIKPVYSKIASSPTKLAEIMAMGVPVVCNSGVGDVARIISDTHAGLVVNDFSEIEYISVLAQLRALTNVDSDMIRHAALNRFSLRLGVERYDEVYQAITAE